MPPDSEIKELMEEYDLDPVKERSSHGASEEEAERLKSLMDELGLDADDALEIVDEV